MCATLVFFVQVPADIVHDVCKHLGHLLCTSKYGLVSTKMTHTNFPIKWTLGFEMFSFRSEQILAQSMKTEQTA
jgi:hypothetical protein